MSLRLRWLLGLMQGLAEGQHLGTAGQQLCLALQARLLEQLACSSTHSGPIKVHKNTEFLSKAVTP